MTEVRERPLLFSAPMVRAILDGRKGMTRRIVKPCVDRNFGCELSPGEIAGEPDPSVHCPYGKPGDRLWVKEAWALAAQYDDLKGKDIVGLPEMGCLRYKADATYPAGFGRPRHARFMPRWASRITLEITDVRAERLQSITEEDAVAEGATTWEYNPEQPLTSGERGGDSPYRSGFAYLWDTINDQRATWKSNPFVWRISFKRIA